MAPSWHQNRTDLEILPNGMNLCDIDLSTSYENLGSHAATMQIIVNQYFVAFDSGYTILKEFKVKPTFSYIKPKVFKITLHKPYLSCQNGCEIWPVSETQSQKYACTKAKLLQEGIFFLIHLFARHILVIKKF